MKKLTDKFILKNGVEIPCVGLGTWQSADGDTVKTAVKAALECGYRHIDTAAIYRNEEGIGEALKETDIPREEVFVTTKIWNKMRGYDNAFLGFERSIGKLGLDYIDLVLIHWPASPERFDDWTEQNLGTWKALTELYKAGRIKAIGVSNFLPHHLEPLMETEVQPMVNQIEFHPGFMQNEAVEYCKKNGILVEAWSPLGTGRMLESPELSEIAKAYGKSVAQLCIRWCLQNGALPLPKSVTPSRIKENSEVFDFEISDTDMQKINAMNDFGSSGLHPDKVDF